jgi:hypothetical protein
VRGNINDLGKYVVRHDTILYIIPCSAVQYSTVQCSAAQRSVT